jgi:hypothetical protein
LQRSLVPGPAIGTDSLDRFPSDSPRSAVDAPLIAQDATFTKEWTMLNDESVSFTEALKRSPTFRKAVMISMMVHIIQQLSGINVVFYYSGYLLGEAGVKGKWIGSLVIAFFNFLSVAAVTPYVDKKGRRILLIVSSFGMVIAAAGITICFYGLKHSSKSSTWGMMCIVFLVMYVSTFEMALGPVPWLLVSELTPTRHRGTVTAIAQLCNWSMNTLIALTSTTLLDALHAFGFVPFGVICLLGGLWIVKTIPETKGLTVREVLSKIYHGHK